MSMLSIFNLANNLSENVGGFGSVMSIAPHNFAGGLDEAASECNFTIMHEAAAFMEYRSVSDDIMTEAAMSSDPSRLLVLTESVLSSLKEKAKAIINKAIAMLKGMAEKVKIFFLRFTRKTKDWAKAMRPRIDAASKRTGISKLTFEMHNWNIGYVTDTIPKATKAVMGGFNEDFAAAKAKDAIDTVTALKPTDTLDNKGGDDPTTQTAVNALKDATEKLKPKIESYKESEFKRLKAVLQVGGTANDMEGLYRDITDKANGGEVTTINLQEYGVDNMMNAVENSAKVISDMESTYTAAIRELGDLKKKIDSEFNEGAKVDENLKHLPNNVTSAYSTYLTTYTQLITTGVSTRISVLTGLQGRSKAYIESMVTDFSKALTKYSNFKEKAE